MKKVYSVFTFAILFSVCAISQPVINSFNSPSFNTKVSAKVKADVLDPGAAGANQIWDFSSYDTTGAIRSTSTVVNPANTPSGSMFSGVKWSRKLSL